MPVLACAAACACAAFAGLGSGGRPADGFVADDVAYARRGALGQDDYVVTNLWTQTPCYALVTGAGTTLVDRAVNRFSVTNDVSFALPGLSGGRSYDAHRPARSFVVVIAIASDPAPEVAFRGARALYTAECDLAIGKGITILSFLEIGEGEFLVESRELTRL